MRRGGCCVWESSGREWKWVTEREQLRAACTFACLADSAMNARGRTVNCELRKANANASSDSGRDRGSAAAAVRQTQREQQQQQRDVLFIHDWKAFGESFCAAMPTAAPLNLLLAPFGMLASVATPTDNINSLNWCLNVSFARFINLPTGNSTVSQHAPSSDTLTNCTKSKRTQKEREREKGGKSEWNQAID